MFEAVLQKAILTVRNPLIRQFPTYHYSGETALMGGYGAVQLRVGRLKSYWFLLFGDLFREALEPVDSDCWNRERMATSVGRSPFGLILRGSHFGSRSVYSPRSLIYL